MAQLLNKVKAQFTSCRAPCFSENILKLQQWSHIQMKNLYVSWIKVFKNLKKLLLSQMLLSNIINSQLNIE